MVGKDVSIGTEGKELGFNQVRGMSLVKRLEALVIASTVTYKQAASLVPTRNHTQARSGK